MDYEPKDVCPPPDPISFKYIDEDLINQKFLEREKKLRNFVDQNYSLSESTQILNAILSLEIEDHKTRC